MLGTRFIFLFESTRFYFKTIFYTSSFIGQSQRISLNASQSYFQLPRYYVYLLANFLSAASVYQTMIKLRQGVLFSGTVDLQKYDYQFFKFAKYTFSDRGDSREYTTRIRTLTRKPYLGVLGSLKHQNGILVNSSVALGPIVKHVSKKGNVCVSVKTSTRAGTDYLISAQQNFTRYSESFVLDFFEKLAFSAAAHTQATQMFLTRLRLKKRHES